MRRRFLVLACLSWFALFAQQGHPLAGTWSGDWGTSATQRTQITIVLSWDGKAVSGILNPGPEAINTSSVQLDATAWSVRIEADTKDKTHIVAEGRIEDLGALHRSIAGTWQQGSTKGTFKLTRE